jgi:hypothetical protein
MYLACFLYEIRPVSFFNRQLNYSDLNKNGVVAGEASAL